MEKKVSFNAYILLKRKQNKIKKNFLDKKVPTISLAHSLKVPIIFKGGTLGAVEGQLPRREGRKNATLRERGHGEMQRRRKKRKSDLARNPKSLNLYTSDTKPKKTSPHPERIFRPFLK